MKIGMMADPWAGTLEDLVDEVAFASRAGLDTYWLAQVWRFDAMTMIPHLAATAPNLNFATGVVATWLRHPLTLATQALTTALLTEGRFTLGVGLMHRPIIEGMLELPFDRPIRHMREFLDVLLPLLSEHQVDVKGETLSYHGPVDVPGAPPCPVVIAALGAQMLDIAGARTEGTITWVPDQRHRLVRVTRLGQRETEPRSHDGWRTVGVERRAIAAQAVDELAEPTATDCDLEPDTLDLAPHGCLVPRRSRSMIGRRTTDRRRQRLAGMPFCIVEPSIDQCTEHFREPKEELDLRMTAAFCERPEIVHLTLPTVRVTQCQCGEVVDLEQVEVHPWIGRLEDRFAVAVDLSLRLEPCDTVLRRQRCGLDQADPGLGALVGIGDGSDTGPRLPHRCVPPRLAREEQLDGELGGQPRPDRSLLRTAAAQRALKQLDLLGIGGRAGNVEETGRQQQRLSHQTEVVDLHGETGPQPTASRRRSPDQPSSRPPLGGCRPRPRCGRRCRP